LPQPFTFLEVYEKDSLKPLEISKYNGVDMVAGDRGMVVLLLKNKTDIQQSFFVHQYTERPLFTIQNQKISIEPGNFAEIVLKRNHIDKPLWYSQIVISTESKELTIRVVNK
jgi:hypothetical protein